MSYFRACDIRGRYPAEIDERLFWGLGRVIAHRWVTNSPILLGCDFRAGSASLKAALVDGLIAGGAQVLDVGRVPTPILYFGKRYLGVDTAAMVTASHNPPEFNGLKLLLKTGPAHRDDMDWLRESWRVPRPSLPGGSIRRVGLLRAYGSFMEIFWRGLSHKGDAFTSPAVALDPGNGSWSRVADAVFRRLHLHCKTIHNVPDGRFPNRPPDCTSHGNLEKLSSFIRRHKVDLGLAWDGDGDRLAVLDEHGDPLLPDQVSLLLLSLVLHSSRKERILVDVKMSRKVKAAAEAAGAIVTIQKSAHCALEQTMIDQDCLFGCEYSGHYFFRELGGADDGMYAGLMLAHLVSQSASLRALVRNLPTFHITPDLGIAAGSDEFAAVERSIIQGFPGAMISRLDGVRIELDNGWFVIRPSVSEEKLSFRFEAESKEDLQAITQRAAELLPQCRTELLDRLNSWYGCGTAVKTG